jgi:DNA polymerase
MDGRGTSRLSSSAAPGADEDRIRLPFVGRAGQLLTDIITKDGLAREDVPHRERPEVPPAGKPRPDEMATCLPYLREQIDIIRPRALVALGATAMEGLTGQTLPMARLRGRWHDFGGIPLMATYHPAYLLRSPGEKKECWKDIQVAMGVLGIETRKAKASTGGSDAT